jgi:hypothetical protein
MTWRNRFLRIVQSALVPGEGVPGRCLGSMGHSKALWVIVRHNRAKWVSGFGPASVFLIRLPMLGHGATTQYPEPGILSLRAPLHYPWIVIEGHASITCSSWSGLREVVETPSLHRLSFLAQAGTPSCDEQTEAAPLSHRTSFSAL